MLGPWIAALAAWISVAFGLCEPAAETPHWMVALIVMILNLVGC